MKNLELKAFMEANNLDQKAVAKLIGKSVTVVSLYLKGTYTGVVEDIDKQVEEILARGREKRVTAYNPQFVHTEKAKKGLGLVRMAHIEGRMGVLLGQSGVGKTEILKYYASNNRSAVLIETDPTCNPKVLLRRIAKAIGTVEVGTNDVLFDGIVARLEGAEMVLLIDEAELLSTRSLEMLRRLRDKTQCGLVLAGMPRLLVNLKGRKSDLNQLYNRVAYHQNLGNEVSKEDLTRLIKVGVGSDELSEAFIKHAHGNARRLSLLMQGVSRMASVANEPMNEEMIEQYAGYLIS